ncbi:outer membrane beta-barrel family protein [Prolixibacteraceae bacterium]|nr:outer membrane beta-barrel family protein [Prolixibacteraceae bacterium]
MKNSLLLLLLLFTLQTYAQSTIETVVLEAKTNNPIAFANVVLKSIDDTTFVRGKVSDQQGKISFSDLTKDQEYCLTVSYVGFTPESYTFRTTQKRVVLDAIFLKEDKTILGEVSVSGNAHGVRYKVDRKVIDAQSFPEATQAIDLLENIPSLDVDYNGEITYREGGTFLVYIDDHPVNNGVQRLQQISTSRIKQIEVITNPPAKYNAEGSAGIIRVVLKKSRLEGYNIALSASMEQTGERKMSYNLEKQGKKGSWYLNGSFRKTIWTYADTKIEQTTIVDQQQNYLRQEMDLLGGGYYNSIDFGFNYDITPLDFVDISIGLHPFVQKQNNFDEGKVWEQNGVSSPIYEYNILTHYHGEYQYVWSTATWKHQFGDDTDHNLSLNMEYSQPFIQYIDKNISTKKTDTFFEGRGYQGSEGKDVELDALLSYEHPIGENAKLEIGVSHKDYRIPGIENRNGEFLEDGTFVAFGEQEVQEDIYYQRMVDATFATLEAKMGKINMKVGARGEWTDRKVEYDDFQDNDKKRKQNNDNYFKLFPSFHLLYENNDENQWAVSYTKRISRPRYYDIVPVKNFSSPYSYHIGNETLQPIYRHSFEVSYRKMWKNNFFNVELYHKRIEQVYRIEYHLGEGNTLYEIPENVGTYNLTGGEIMIGIDITKWWNVNLSTKAFHHITTFEDASREVLKQFCSNVRLNNKMRLGQLAKLKWDVRYSSPFDNGQTKQDGFWYCNGSVSKSLWKKHWNVTFSYNHIFDRRTTISTIDDPTIQRVEQEHRKPFYTLKLSYQLNNQK